MAARDRATEVLLPLGASLDFMFQGDGDSYGMGHGVHGYLLQELLSQGGTGLLVTPYSAVDHDPDTPSSIRKRLRRCDDDGELAEAARAFLSPCAREQGFDPSKFAPMDHIFDDSAGYALELEPERRKGWSKLALVYNGTYQLLLGMQYGVQIDIPLGRLKHTLAELIADSGPSRSGANLASLLGVFHSYEPVTIAAPVLRPDFMSNASIDWVEHFGDFVEDETFAEYALIRSEIGLSKRRDALLARAGQLTRRVVRSSPFRGLFKAGQRVARAATGIPTDAMELDRYFRRERFLPPVVSMRRAILQASHRWEASTGAKRLVLELPDFSWFSPRSQLPRELAVDRADFVYKQQVFAGTERADPADPAIPALLEPRFRKHFATPVQCQEHGGMVTFDDVEIHWLDELVVFRLPACCESLADVAIATLTGLGIGQPDPNQRPIRRPDI